MKRLDWSIYTTDYLILSFMKQLRRKKISRTLIKELEKRGVLSDILNLLPQEMRQQYTDVISFIESVISASLIREAKGLKWRFPEKLAKFPLIVKDYLTPKQDYVIDKFEDDNFLYEFKDDGDALRVVMYWKF